MNRLNDFDNEREEEYENEPYCYLLENVTHLQKFFNLIEPSKGPGVKALVISNNDLIEQLIRNYPHVF